MTPEHDGHDRAAPRRPPLLGRRRFLRWVGAACGAGASWGCASVASVRAPLEAGRVRLRLVDHPGLTGPGGWLRVLPDGWSVPVLVLADGAGGWTALSPVCTHLGCVVDVDGDDLVCPCHGSTYRRSGDVVRGPAERPLAGFPVREDPPGTLVLQLEAERTPGRVAPRGAR